MERNALELAYSQSMKDLLRSYMESGDEFKKLSGDSTNHNSESYI